MRKESEHCRRRHVTMAIWFFTTCLLIASIPVHAKTKDLLEFNSGSHVLGFSSGSMYMASGTHVLKVEFVGGKSVVPVSREGLSSDGKAPPWSKVTYPNIWDGVDIVYEGAKGSIVKSTYTVAAGKAPGSIRLRYNRPLTLDKKGNLVVRYETGTITESKPIAWQVIEGKKKPVMVAYNLYSEKEVGFTVKDYDTSLPLVIDPYFSWNTFLGGSGTDYGYAIAVDSGGNIYVAGASNATWGTSPVRAYTSSYDAFVAKLTADGSLVWNTFLGGGNADYSQALTVDSAGNVYVTGISTATWGTPVRAYSGPGYDAFVAKLTTDGSLVWNTFLGGGNNDWGSAIAVDSAGNAYVAGYGDDDWGSPIKAYAGGKYDAFVAKLTTDGALAWNTFLGGYGEDHGCAVAAGQDGNVYVAGRSDASWGSPIRGHTSGYDAFVAKLTTDGALVWNTFLGGYDSDWANAIAVSLKDYVYVAGDSYASWGSPIRPYTYDLDAFAAKLTSNGDLVWHTFLGGKGADRGKGIGVDSKENPYIVGDSGAKWASPIRAYTASIDAFAAGLDPKGALLWNAFLGGKNTDQGAAAAVDSIGNAYVTGYSVVAWGDPVRPYTGSNDAFVAKIGFSDAFTLSVSINGAGLGSVISNPPGIDCGSTCTGSFSPGASVTLIATANGAAAFSGFSGCDSTSGSTCTVVMTSDRAVTAAFNLGCTYTISPASKPFTYKGGSANVAIQATGASCASPFVYVSDTWIIPVITSYANNKGAMKISVLANETVTERSGAVTIGGSTFYVTQAGSPCSLASISPTGGVFDPAGGSGSFNTTAVTGCRWNVSPSVDWLIPFTSVGTGMDSVAYTVSANRTGKQRTGKITVCLADNPTKKKVFTVKQSPCSLTIAPTSDTFTAEGGSDSFTVTTPTGCPWSVSPSVDWLTTTTSSGSGPGSVSYTAVGNTGKQRTGKITVYLNDTPTQKKVFTVTEKKGNRGGPIPPGDGRTSKIDTLHARSER